MPLDRQALRFLVVGLINTGAGLGTIFASKRLGNLGDVGANVLGYAVGLGVSFLLNKAWTFDWSGKTLGALRRFLLVFGVAYTANLAAVLWLIRVGVNPDWAQVFGVLPYTVIFFFGSRHYAFSPAQR